MFRLIIRLVSGLAVMLPLVAASAQPGPKRLEGDVLRSAGGDPVPGANVVLVGTLYGAVTDEAGHFSLGVVRAGSYVLRVSITGLTPVERALNIPEDLGEPLVIVLREARADLAREPLAAIVEGFRADVAVPSLGDPYLADTSDRLRRVAGVRLRRFAAAYAGTEVRVLSVRGAGTGAALLTDPPLELPGVGWLDFGSVLASGMGAFVVMDPIPGATTGDAFVGLSRDRRGSTFGTRDRLVADVGYQSNLNVFTNGLAAAGSGAGVHAAAAARYSTGRDFASATDEVWDGGFSHGGVVVNAGASPGRGSTVTVSGRAAAIGFADLPGTGLEVESARHAGLAGGWTTSPETDVVRRTDVSVEWSLSSADLAAASPPGDWTRVAVDQQRMRATVAADLFTGTVDQLQAGATVSSREYDWHGAPAAEAADSPGDTRVDAGRMLVSPFLFSAMSVGRMELSVSARLDVARSRLGADAARTSATTSWDVLPGLAAAVSYRPDRRWLLSITASTVSAEPPLTAMSSARITPASRLPGVPVLGNPDLRPERLFFAGSRVTRTSASQVATLAAFVMSIDGYVAPTPDGAGQFAYENLDAVLAGFELSASRELMPFVRGSGFLAFAWGRNRTIAEPLPLVYPLNGRLSLTASAARGRLLFEVSGEFALRQGRVAASLDERAADGYAAFHLWLAIPVNRRFGLRTGINNMFNARVSPHENVFVRDREGRLPAPGRSWVVSGHIRY